MNITELLDLDCLRVPLVSNEKMAAIEELVDVLNEAGRLSNRDEVLSAVIAREETRSTGIGEGLAVPHGKAHGCPRLSLAIGKPSEPIDFGSKDGRPCELIFLLASPADEMGPHIQALARISRIWLSHDFRRAARQVTNAEQLFDAILRHQQ